MRGSRGPERAGSWATTWPALTPLPSANKGGNPSWTIKSPWDHTRGVGLRLLIVDDHAGFRAVARKLLQGDGFEVVAEAADGREALTEAARAEPEVVLLDVHLPGSDGFAVGELLACLPCAPTVVLTSSAPIPDLQARLARDPAVAFLPKNELSGRSLSEAVAS